MELSNKALAVLLLAAMVVSLGGTFYSLNKMNEVQYVGYALSDTGIVNLSIEEVISITTQDGNLVNFGTCVTNNLDLTLTSEAITPNCTGYNTTDNITNISVRNDGNANINVTIQSNNVGTSHGGTFILDENGGTDSWIAFKATNSSRGPGVPGCQGGLQSTYTNFTANNTEYLACGNLSFGGTGNSFVTDYEMMVPAATFTGLNEITVTFTAQKITN